MTCTAATWGRKIKLKKVKGVNQNWTQLHLPVADAPTVQPNEHIIDCGILTQTYL